MLQHDADMWVGRVVLGHEKAKRLTSCGAGDNVEALILLNELPAARFQQGLKECSIGRLYWTRLSRQRFCQLSFGFPPFL